MTFDEPQTVYRDLPLDAIGLTGVAPLFEPIDLTRGGGIYFKESNGLLIVLLLHTLPNPHVARLPQCT